MSRAYAIAPQAHYEEQYETAEQRLEKALQTLEYKVQFMLLREAEEKKEAPVQKAATKQISLFDTASAEAKTPSLTREDVLQMLDNLHTVVLQTETRFT